MAEQQGGRSLGLLHHGAPHQKDLQPTREWEMKESRFPNYKEREKEEGERERELAVRKCKFPKFFWVVKGCVWRERERFSTDKHIFIELQGTLNLFPVRQLNHRKSY